MKKILSYLVLVLLGLMPFGCSSDSADGGNTTNTNTPNALVGTAITDGTSVAISLGLPLLPNQTATVADAKIALTAIGGSILPVLTGTSSAANTAALQALITQITKGQLTSLSGAPLVQSALQLALPLLTANLPNGLVDASGAVTSNIPPVALAYLTDFFQGASSGLTAYTSGKSMKDLPKNYDPKTGNITAGTAVVNVNDIVAKLTAIQKGVDKAVPPKK
jgi:hypothetical protein